MPLSLVAEGTSITPTTVTAARVEVLQAETEEEIRQAVAVSAPVWGYSPEQQEQLVLERVGYLGIRNRRGGYLLAMVGGQAAGTASYRYSGDGRTIYLSGASTLPYFRGRGVFHALVQWRLAQARARGCRLAAVLARQGTSAPILRNLGFTRYFDMPVYQSPITPAS